MPEINVQDEQGNTHVFPDGSTPEMIAKAMGVKPPSAALSPLSPPPIRVPVQKPEFVSLLTGRKSINQGNNDAPMPGVSDGPGLAEGLGEYDKASGGEVGGGAHDLFKGDFAKGLHRIISGIGAGLTPAVALTGPATVAAAPVTSGVSVGTGLLGSKLARAAASSMGATPDQTDLAGDVGGFAGGYGGTKLNKLGPKLLLRGKTPAEAYQSALKPSTTLGPDKTGKIVQTALDENIPVSKGGLAKLGDLIDDLNSQVKQTIASDPDRPIDTAAVTQPLKALKLKFANQVNPNADLAAIDSSEKEFLHNQGARPGQPATPPQPTGILDASGQPVMSPGSPATPPTPPRPMRAEDAQTMKQGTYQQLSSKAYGELGTASEESQKALARGLKEEIAKQFPEIGPVNARESKMLDLQPVLEKAVARIGNHQFLGIGTPITVGATKAVTGSSKLAGVAGILKAVLDDPNVKSRLAIAVSNGAKIPHNAAMKRIAVYSGALAAAANSGTSDDHTSQ
jgi:hypothetical protein